MPAKKPESKEIIITAIKRGRVTLHILGMTPRITNKLSEKTKRELVLPRGRRSTAEKQSTLKHDVIPEYQASMYIDKNPNSPTLLQSLTVGFKLGACSMPLDIPNTGTNKTQMGRMLVAPVERVPLYGVPQLHMGPVRSADMNHTPDVRCRGILPQWACSLDLTYMLPVLKVDVVLNLVAAAGFARGVDDWRPEKGNGSYGCYEVVEEDDPRYLAVIRDGGRAAQQAAFDNPQFYDDDTRDLYEWYVEERARRGFDDLSAKGNGKKRLIEEVNEAFDEEEEGGEEVQA